LKNVVYVTPLYFDRSSYLGGGERYPLNLAKATALSGEHTVTLVSYGDVEEVLRRPLAPGVTLEVLPTARRRPGAERLSWAIVEALQRADVAHIHQIFTRSGEVAFLAAKLLDKPVVVSDHGGASSDLGRSLGILELADRIVCYSAFGESLLGSHPSGIRLIRGGVDDEFFTPPAAPATREAVLFVGRLLPHKGVDRLIVAMPPDVPLVVCGQPYDPAYYEVLRALAVGKRVEFVTSADDRALRELYRRALAVVLPSVYVDFYGNTTPWPELMGLSLLEGAACGAPAICSRVGGMPEFVDDGSTGFVYDELAALTRAVERLRDDPGLVASLGGAGREAVEQRWGLEAVGDAMRDMYDSLTEGARV
jgi:glycosyltransferase involved in cell wall biosynthesis